MQTQGFRTFVQEIKKDFPTMEEFAAKQKKQSIEVVKSTSPKPPKPKKQTFKKLIEDLGPLNL